MPRSSFLTLFAASAGFCFASLGAVNAHAEQISFYPAQEWSITKQDKGCRISNQYNNGYIVSFDVGVSGPQSASVNFRQDIFTQGQAYEVTYSVPGVAMDTASAVARTPNTLHFDINDSSIIYPGIAKSGLIDLSVEGNDFRFMTTGFASNAAMLADCMTPVIIEPAVPDIPAVTAETKPIPQKAASPLQTVTRLQPEAPAIPPVETLSFSTPEPVVKRTVGTSSADISNIGKPDYALKIATLESQLARVMEDNTALQEKLATQPLMPEAVATDAYALSSDNWDLERATLRFQEAERQLKVIGQKLQRERAQCQVEKKELEAMLFDPQITNQRQLAQLADLETQLAEAQEDIINLRVQYEARIKVLENQLKGL